MNRLDLHSAFLLQPVEKYDCHMDPLDRHHRTALINVSTVVISIICLGAAQSRDLKVSNPAWHYRYLQTA